MIPIRADELLSLAEYELVRARLRPLLIAEKNRRRLALGAHMTLLFENPQTVWYQVQEMLRIEKIEKSEAIQHELDTYNALLPKPGELSATLLIEYAEPQTRDAALVRLVGLENHFWSVAGERRTQAEFDRRQFDGERVSSVQFVRFPLPGMNHERFIALAQKGELAIEADHPAFAARAVIAGDTAASLAEDLR